MVKGISFRSTPYLSGGKGENNVDLGKYTEVDATEPYTSSTSNARLALTFSITDECSPFTQEHSSYENPPTTMNDYLERQLCEHDPDDNGAYETFNNIKIETNASGGNSNRSNAIRSDISEYDNQVGIDCDSDSSYTTAQDSSASSTESGAEELCYANIAISNNDDLGNQTREHDPDDENSNTIKTVTNVSGSKSNHSGAIPSNISENGNQVGTVSDTASSYETARESSESSTESGAEASVTVNTPNDQLQASPCIYHIVNVKSVTFNIANK